MAQDVQRRMIVEVTAVSWLEDLDANDLDESGACAVDGAYRIVLAGGLAERGDPVEAALDVFHATVPVACLDDFDILVRGEMPGDEGDGWLRRDLGVHSEVPSPSEGPAF
jgi:hypothetical protein